MDITMILFGGLILALVLVLGKNMILPESFEKRQFERDEKKGNDRLEKKRQARIKARGSEASSNQST